jgi:protease-4
MSETENKEQPQVTTANSATKNASDNTWMGSSADDSWERDILNRLAFASLNEQRRNRRWRVFFMLLFFIYLFLLYFTIHQPEWGNWVTTTEEIIGGDKYTALVEVEGIIASEMEASADRVISGLRHAFKSKETAGVILRINSPGGSPVQAGYINDEIGRLREKHPNIPIYAVATDLCASGGYYIAVAADKIYADKASVVGSIGVLMSSFGFVEAMSKLGIERRLLTAGENKGFFDPFSPVKEEDVDHLKKVLQAIHQQFIEKVKQGRAKSLETGEFETMLEQHPEILSGLVWTGEQALELGLIDGFGSASYVAREIIGAEKIKDFTLKPNYLDHFAQRLGATMAKTLAQHLTLQQGQIR